MKTFIVFTLVALSLTLLAQTPPNKKNKVTIKTKKPDTAVAIRPLPVVIEEYVSVDVEPEPISNVQQYVVYPREAKEKGLTGKVIISALIDTNGRVINTRIEKSDHKIFEQPAIDAIKATRFTPARQNGLPVKLWYTVPITFRM